jgi:hypothetical protein
MRVDLRRSALMNRSRLSEKKVECPLLPPEWRVKRAMGGDLLGVGEGTCDMPRVPSSPSSSGIKADVTNSNTRIPAGTRKGSVLWVAKLGVKRSKMNRTQCANTGLWFYPY